jgi:hypothetical protein
MRVWTDGSLHLVSGEEGIEVHRPNTAAVLHALGKPQKGAHPPRDVLAVVSSDPLQVWVGSGADVRLVALDESARIEKTIPANILDAIGLGDGRVLACAVLPGERSPRLVVVDGAAPDFAAATDLSPPAARRITWPGGIWEKDVAWPEDDVEEGDEPLVLDALALGYPQTDGRFLYDEVLISANEHGITVTGVYVGIVAALPRDASKIDFAVRVPTQVGETEIFAARTAAGGVVVVHCIEGRHAAVTHLASDGTVLGNRFKIGRDLAWGMGPPVVQGERVVVFEAGAQGADRLHELKLPALEVAKSAELGEHPTGRLSVWTSPTSDPFVLGLGAKARLIKRGPRGRIDVEALTRPPPKVAAPPRAIVQAPSLRMQGPPALALSKGDQRLSPWTMTTEEPSVIEIPFTNQGGASRGVAIEISGPAFQSGLVRTTRAKVGDVETMLTSKPGAASVRGELGELAMEAGFTPIGSDKKGALPPPAAPSLYLRIEIFGVRPGNAVLTVRITPLKALPGRGSVLQGKSVTVTAPSADAPSPAPAQRPSAPPPATTEE